MSLSGANPSPSSEQTKVVVTARSKGTPAVKCLHQKLALLGEVAEKVIMLAGITCDVEIEMLILTMYLKKSNTLRRYLNTNLFNL